MAQLNLAVEAEEKKSLHDETMDALTKIYETATPQDLVAVDNLVKRAANQTVEMVDITPGIAARLFFDHNKQNREWSAVTAQEYCRQIVADEWDFTSQGIGFLKSGNVGDGQHRLSGIALSGKVVKQVVAFGMEVEAILSLDIAKRRSAATFGPIVGYKDEPKRKENLIKIAYNYLNYFGSADKLRTPRAVFKKMKEHNDLLAEAIELGVNSVKGIVNPTLSVRDAQASALLFLLNGWPKERIVEKMAVFQLGQDTTGENSPFFVTAKVLEKQNVRGESASTLGRLAATVQAFRMDEIGIKAIRPTQVKGLIKDKKNLPDPKFPHLHAAS